MKKHLILFFIMILFFINCGYFEIEPGSDYEFVKGKVDYNGNWWNKISTQSKMTYIVGFANGYYNGRNEGIWSVMSKKDLEYSEFRDELQAGAPGKFDNIYVEQLIAGIDEIYKEKKYRILDVVIIVELALAKIKGEDKEEIEFYLEAELERIK